MQCQKTCPPKELRKPRLGIPDSYSHDDHHSEDKLSWVHVTVGFQNHLAVEDECGSALKEIQHYIHAKEFTTKISAIMDIKRRSAVVQDGQKKKITITKDNFSALHIIAGGQKKGKWMQDLAGTKPLIQLLKNDKIPGFNKKDELFDALCEYCVPMKRAIWFIKMTAFYMVSLNESKVKRKHNNDQSYEWTIALTKYLQNCANKLCSKSKSVSELLLLLKPANEESPSGDQSNMADLMDTTEDGRKLSVSGTPSEVSEATKWTYCCRLVNWLYHERLLDRHELLRWMVEKLEAIKSSNEAGQCLYLQLVIKYLSDISRCVSLSRPLVHFCLKKLCNLHRMSQRIESSGVLEKPSNTVPSTPAPTPSSATGGAVKQEREDGSVKVEKADELDSVFSPGVADGNTTDLKQRRSSIVSNSENRKELPSTTADDTQPTPGRSHRNHTNPSIVDQGTVTMTGDQPTSKQQQLFSWCNHHQKLVGLLSCVIQTISLSSTTSLVYLPLAETSKPAVAREDKDYSLLRILPFSISNLPMPNGLSEDRRKQFVISLHHVEQEVRTRSLAAATGWSAPTNSSEAAGGGTVVLRLLELLDMVDKHLFHVCQWSSTVTSLYDKIQSFSNTSLGSDVFVMVLCQWAVTPHREGLHRPLIVAHILERRQQELLKGGVANGCHDNECCCPEIEETVQDGNDYPFHDTLVKFLDTRAPLPSNTEKPFTVEEPFFQLIVLFGELIRKHVFCYERYLSMLISRGNLQAPVIPKFSCIKHAKISHSRVAGSDGSPLLPSAKRGRFDLPMSSIAAQKDNSSSTPGGILTPSGPHLLTPVFNITPSREFVLGSQTEVFTAFDNISPTFDLGTSNHSNTNKPSQPTHPIVSSERGAVGNDDVLIIQERQRKLQQLICEDSGGRFPLIISPTDSTLSPSKSFTAKTDPFGFLPGQSSEHLSESDDSHAAINIEAEKHGLYAAHFPIPSSYLHRSDLNECMTALCGAGSARKKVSSVLEALSLNIEQFFHSVSNSTTRIPLVYSNNELMRQFAILPVFHQRKITTTCELLLRKMLQDVSDGGGLSHYPHPTQFSFLCDLMETTGDITSIIELLVDVVACGSEEEKDSFGVNPRPAPLPNELCVPVVCLLYKFLPSLLTSQHYTTVVFENLCRVLVNLQEPNASISGPQRAVLCFLKHLYSSCYYLQKPFSSTFGDIQSPFGDILQESFPPVTTDMPWNNRSSMAAQLSNPSLCNTQQICNMLRTNNQNVVMFIYEAVNIACHMPLLNSLCQLVQIFSDVCCAVPSASGQLMGALRAICLQTNRKSGFQQLVERVNLMDVNIHQKVIQFITLLLAHNCIIMDDLIKYVIMKILKVAVGGSATERLLDFLLKFTSGLVMALFIDPVTPPILSHPSSHQQQQTDQLVLPSYVSHFLYASRRRLPLGVTIDLLKEIHKLTRPSTSGKSSVIAAGKGSMQQVHVQSLSSNVSSKMVNELETLKGHLAGQSWLREKCLANSDQLFDKERLGALGIHNARHLFNLLCPLPNVTEQTNGETSSVSTEDILRNLDQWTLRTSLLHIESIISQTPSQSRSALLEQIAMHVISLFEESCTTEWIGPMEATVEQGDGAYSPAIWLVTPLVSKLHLVLGKVLKNAGHVLGRGQWWNPDKIQEKRRSTRANSGVAQLRCSLQWQQPFLELVLVCMKSHKAAHEDLLVPLKQQLTTFLIAYEKEGPSADEQSRMTLYAAIRLRLSLLGSMLSSVCTNEGNCLDWIMLLMQLLCSGAIDRQPENSEVFTHTLDMLFSLLNAMSGDLLNPSTTSIDDPRRSQVVKKLMSEVANAKSSCVDEIKQLFSVALKKFEVPTVEYPSWIQQVGNVERKRGIKVNEIKEVSPWELIEGVKTTNGLPLSLYGGARVERKPLKYEEQYQLIQVHSHSRHLPSHNFVYIANQKDLPTANPSADMAGDATRQDSDQGQSETINNLSSEQNISQDQKPQHNTTMMPLQTTQQMMGQQKIQMMPQNPSSAGVQLPLQVQQRTLPGMSNPVFRPNNPFPRPQMPQAFNPQQQQIGPYQMKQSYPPPYHQQGNEVWRPNSGAATAADMYESKKRDQLKQIQVQQLRHAQRQQIEQMQMGPSMQPQPAQSRPGVQYTTGIAGQQMQPQQQQLQRTTGMLAQRNMQDYLNQFTPDQREIVYQRILLKRMQQQQQVQAMRQQQQQQQQQQPMSMGGGAVRANFVRQTGYPGAHVGAMNQMQQRQRMMQGAGALQQARQQQLLQLQQQQFQQQQQQFGGGGYGQFN